MSGEDRNLRCCSLKIRPKDNRRLSSLNTLTEFLYFQNSMCHLQKGKHPIYINECLGEEEGKGRSVNNYKLLENGWGSRI